jgi:hypothetical protein
MAMIAQLYSNGRAAERHPLDADATLRGEDQLPLDILIADLSATGCLFVCAETLALNADITIGIAGIGRHRATIVRSLGQRYGCEFSVALTDAETAAARAASGGTIIGFPVWSHAADTREDDLPSVAKLSPRARLLVMVGATAAAWTGLILAVRLLHQS